MALTSLRRRTLSLLATRTSLPERCQNVDVVSAQAIESSACRTFAGLQGVGLADEGEKLFAAYGDLGYVRLLGDGIGRAFDGDQLDFDLDLVGRARNIDYLFVCGVLCHELILQKQKLPIEFHYRAGGHGCQVPVRAQDIWEMDVSLAWSMIEEIGRASC